MAQKSDNLTSSLFLFFLFTKIKKICKGDVEANCTQKPGRIAQIINVLLRLRFEFTLELPQLLIIVRNLSYFYALHCTYLITNL
jgi:hypothetical protein